MSHSRDDDKKKKKKKKRRRDDSSEDGLDEARQLWTGLAPGYVVRRPSPPRHRERGFEAELLPAKETGRARIGQERAARRALRKEREDMSGGLVDVADHALYGDDDTPSERRRRKAARFAALVEEMRRRPR